MSQTIELNIKVQTKEGPLANLPSTITTLEAWETWYSAYLDKRHDEYWCVVAPHMIDKIRSLFKDDDDVTVRSGITGGCYGARDGSVSEGLTLWLDSSLFPERWIDSEGDEIVNIEALLNEHAECLEDLDVESFLDACEALGHEIKCDNTYNYLGHNEGDVQPFCHADYQCIQTEPTEYGCKVIVVKFHCGGDPRGNYAQEHVYKFNDAEAFYSVFNPTQELGGES